MFEAALATIQPNFPPGILQSDPRYSNLYFNMSSGNDFTGPWNSGKSTQFGEDFQFIEDPIKHVMETNGLLDQQAAGTDRTEKEVQAANIALGKERSTEVNASMDFSPLSWNIPPDETAKANKSLNTNGKNKSKKSGR